MTFVLSGRDVLKIHTSDKKKVLDQRNIVRKDNGGQSPGEKKDGHVKNIALITLRNLVKVIAIRYTTLKIYEPMTTSWS